MTKPIRAARRNKEGSMLFKVTVAHLTSVIFIGLFFLKSTSRSTELNSPDLKLVRVSKLNVASNDKSGDTLSVSAFIGASLSEDAVKVKIDDAHFNIPRNYLEWADLSRQFFSNRGTVDIVNLRIVTTFPSFSGAKPDTINCYQRLGSCPEKTITIYTIDRNASVSDRLAPALDAARTSLGLTDTEHFDKSAALVKVDVKVSLVPNDIYVSYGGSLQTSVVLECSREDIANRSTSCRVYKAFHGVPFMYEYHRSLLPKWRTIDDGITQLLEFVLHRTKQMTLRLSPDALA